MLSKKWTTTNTIEGLVKNPENFDFFQAIRLLEMEYGQADESLFQHAIRFYVDTSLAFPDATIYKIRLGKTVTVNTKLFGLNTNNGALATHFLESLMLEKSSGESSFHDFISIFNHRILAILYRSWRKHKLYLDTTHQHFLQSFSHSRDDSSYYFAGAGSHKTQTAEGLSMILSHYFELDVSVKQHVGYWVDIPDDACTRLASCQEINNLLGKNSILGVSFWDRLSRIKIILFIKSYDYFLEFLPGKIAYAALQKKINAYVQQHIIADIELVLSAKEVLPCQLRTDNPHHLGWNSWLCHETSLPQDGRVTIKRT